jgi:hypothetical protein
VKHSLRPRKTANLSESVHHHLNQYALLATVMGAGFMASVQPAHAKIVYTGAHHRLPLNKDFFLDLNHDGIKDFRFHVLTSDVNVRGTSGTQDSAFLWAYPQGTANQVIGKQPYASALRAGARIGPKGLFNPGRGTMGGVIFEGFQPQYLGPWAASGQPVNRRYVGLKFIINGKVHFGWARFNVRVYRNPESTVHAVLTGYAYETIPNKPIIAGKAKGRDVITMPDTAGTLGHLALGKK